MKVIFGTTNKRKLEDLNAVISQNNYDVEVLSLSDIGWNRDEIEEGGSTLEENSMIKAMAILDFCQASGIEHTIITDDAGLFVDALGGEPGIFTARYADPEKAQDPTLPAHESANKIVRLMQGQTNRSATFSCAVTCVRPNGEVLQVSADTKGVIAESVREPIKKPYAYTVFLVENTGKTFFELPYEETYETYRMNALKKALDALGAPKTKTAQNKEYI